MDRHTPIPGEFYRHFKDKLYQIREIAEHTETGELLVIYQALYGDYRIYARPLTQFMSPVDHTKYPESKETWRFSQVTIGEQASGMISIPTAIPLTASTVSSTSGAAAQTDTSFTTTTDQTDMTPEQLFVHFLDVNTCKEKLETLVALRSKLTRSMTDSIAASMDLVLPGKSIESDLELIEDHLRTRAKFESRRYFGA